MNDPTYRAALRPFIDMAHRAPAPIPADDWRRDILLVLGAIALLVILAVLAVLMSPATTS
jgi:hypothetical protein